MQEPVSSADIAIFFDNFLRKLDEESQSSFSKIEDSPVMQSASQAISDGNANAFFLSLLYPFNKLVDGLLSKELPGLYKAHFLLSNARFVESHFKGLITRFEGSACCADKSRTIIKQLLQFLVTGKAIEFDYTQEYTYHLPKRLFTIHDDIIIFFDALQQLHSGNPDAYLLVMCDIVKRENKAAKIAEEAA